MSRRLIKRWLVLVWLALAFGGSSPAESAWLDKSEAAFFPSGFAEKLSRYKSFRALWWNFIVIDAPPEELAGLCQALQSSPAIDKADCGSHLGPWVTLAEDFARDLPLRSPVWSGAEWSRHFREALARASLPLPREILQLLRHDPAQTHRFLLASAETKMPLRLPKREGVFWDEARGRSAIAFIPRFSPGDTAQFLELEKLVDSESKGLRWGVVGPHASAFENRRQVERDLRVVSLLGTLFLVGFAFTVVWLRRKRLLWGVPFLFLASGVGTLAAVGWFGSVHGIVLSFGIGIMGLLLDYSLHGAFNSRAQKVWLSNLVGLITTLVVFAVLAFSQIPLLRQLAVYSLAGLSSCYFAIYLLHRKFSKQLAAEPLALPTLPSTWLTRVVVVSLAGLLLSFWYLRPSLDMRQLDYQSAATRELQNWLGQFLQGKGALLELVQGDWRQALDFAQSRKNWADANQIPTESIASYLPPLAELAQNRASWREQSCAGKLGRPFSQTEQRYFAPFLERLSCASLSSDPLGSAELPAYLRGLASDDNWLFIWLPTSVEQVALIHRQFPQAASLIELVNAFPATLAAELTWMAPLCLLLILLVLWGHTRRFSLAVVALLPFATGLGMLLWLRPFGLPFSFISLVGVILLLGLGVDYGIFAVDHARQIALGENEETLGKANAGLTSALLFSAVTTILGYLPLVFCAHPVLAHLGQVLAIGTLGSSLGAFFGVPLLVRWVQR